MMEELLVVYDMYPKNRKEEVKVYFYEGTVEKKNQGLVVYQNVLRAFGVI